MKITTTRRGRDKTKSVRTQMFSKKNWAITLVRCFTKTILHCRSCSLLQSHIILIWEFGFHQLRPHKSPRTTNWGFTAHQRPNSLFLHRCHRHLHLPKRHSAKTCRPSMFQFLSCMFSPPSRSESPVLPAAPPNTLEYEQPDAEPSRSVWQPMATAIAFFALHRFAQRQQLDFLHDEYGNWGERLLYRLTRARSMEHCAGSKRKRL